MDEERKTPLAEECGRALEEMHRHAHRPRRRRKIPNGTRSADAIAEVFTLCGRWVLKSYAIRHDAPTPARPEVCHVCAKASS